MKASSLAWALWIVVVLLGIRLLGPGPDWLLWCAWTFAVCVLVVFNFIDATKRLRTRRTR